MLTRLSVMLPIVMLISSCGTNGPVKPVIVDTACNWVQPIYLTEQDVQVMDMQTKRAVLAHDEKWSVNCGEKH
ncbi:hypothetical protein AAM22_gp55 [Pantoea phage vB_PagM_AAM22]|nr:hypothetical protein AAM22_gp55 [Pantoea phage vB_PagM_AAM22]